MKASKGRILPSGDGHITALALDFAATASHPSWVPSATAQGRIQLLEAECRCQLLGAVHYHSPGWEASDRLWSNQLPRNGVPTIDNVDPDVVEASGLPRST